MDDESEKSPSLQAFYVKCAAQSGDWRAMRGAKPTPKMLDLFVIARSKYLAWKHRRDEEEDIEASLPKFWFEIAPGHWVRASSEEKAFKISESLKPVVNVQKEEHERGYVEIDIDTSKTCPRCRLRRVQSGKPLCEICLENAP